MRVERHTDAEFLNRVANDPSVAPMIRGYQPGPLNFSDMAKDENIFILAGEYGALVFHRHQFGLFEVHSQVLKEGRGAWALEFAWACLSWMFCRTEAMEILTRCPKGNLPALALAKRVGMRKSFINPQGWVKDLDPIPADIMWLSVHDWLQGAPELEDQGMWFRARLDSDFKRHGWTKEWPNVPAFTRYAGATFEMCAGGQADKAVLLFNRFAVMADCAPVQIINYDPLTIDIGDALVIVSEGDCWTASIKTAGLKAA